MNRARESTDRTMPSEHLLPSCVAHMDDCRKRRTLTRADGTVIPDAQYPVIVSASRSTDIPALYADWFFSRLDAGYSVWKNPFNNRSTYVSYEDTRFIVFWSKNPAPLLPYLDTLRKKGIHCYVQFTLNDYDAERYEPGVTPAESRITTFRTLSERLGRKAVIWRSDPLMLTDMVRTDDLLRKMTRIGDALHGYTEKLVFSFVDIACYARVRSHLRQKHIRCEDWTPDIMRTFATELKALNERRGWGYTLATCAEQIDLDDLGIVHNRCIDDRLIIRIAHEDTVLMKYLGYEKRPVSDMQYQESGLLPDPGRTDATPQENVIRLDDGSCAVRTTMRRSKDSGQRPACGCCTGKDIGQYSTCTHLCVYCYANSSEASVLSRYASHLRNRTAETITGI